MAGRWPQDSIPDLVRHPETESLPDCPRYSTSLYPLRRYLSELPEQEGVRTRSCSRREGACGREALQTVVASYDQLSTSDYCSNVSTSGSSRLDKLQAASPAEEVQESLEVSWDSDSDSQLDAAHWEEEAEAAWYKTQQCLVLCAGEARLLLPQANLHSLPSSAFSISLASTALTPSLRVHHVSPIVQTNIPSKLRGAPLFSPVSPAYLILPIAILPHSSSRLRVLCSDDTQPPPCPLQWHNLTEDTFRYDEEEGYMLVKTCCLHSFFTVVYEEELPQISKTIRSRIGGSLVHSRGASKITVKFPRFTCMQDTDAFLRILYDRVPGCPDTEPNLACPIVMLGPHGFRVRPNGKKVVIELPVPDYHKIIEKCPKARLVVYESDTKDGSELAWTKVELKRQSINEYSEGFVSISFGVYHFSFFKVVWTKLSESLYSTKCGVSWFLPFITFPMSCKAYMEENPGDNTFGMEVVCFNPESNPDQNQRSTYRYCVGSNLKPKFVKPGRIVIKLRSQKFEANVEAGEEVEMEKEEPDFRGRDFEKQFSCIFKRDIRTNIDRGTFGKVILDRVDENKEKLENLFEFNLNKTGIETEASAPDSSDRWSIVAIKELAGSLSLTDETRMKKFAQCIGFTNHEISTRLQHSPDPFRDLLTQYQQRGGTPEDFVQALYAVSRDFSVASSGCGSNKSNDTPLSTSSGISGSGSQQSANSQESGLAQMHQRFSFLNPWRSKDDGSDSGTADMRGVDRTPEGAPGRSTSPVGSAKKRPRARDARPPSGGKRRRIAMPAPSFKGSYKMDDSFSSSDESGQDEGRARAAAEVKSISTEKHMKSQMKLADGDLWQISSQMNGIKWRALGRTLGMAEDILMNLESAHKGSGVRECAYQMLLNWKEVHPRHATFGSLYSALAEEKMNMVAKHMAKLLTTNQLKGQN